MRKQKQLFLVSIGVFLTFLTFPLLVGLAPSDIAQAQEPEGSSSNPKVQAPPPLTTTETLSIFDEIFDKKPEQETISANAASVNLEVEKIEVVQTFLTEEDPETDTDIPLIADKPEPQSGLTPRGLKNISRSERTMDDAKKYG